MGCKTESKQIGEKEFSATQWPAEKAILNKIKLIKIFGAGFALLAGKNNDVSSALSTIFDNAEPEEITKLVKDFVIGSGCDGKRITESSFTEIFSGDDLMDVYKVFIFVIHVNYSNLLKGQWAEQATKLAKEAIK